MGVITEIERQKFFAYLDGVADGLNESRNDVSEVLDKIRAEIEQLRLHKAQFITSDNKVCIDSQAVLDIIDKYRGESEVENGNDD